MRQYWNEGWQFTEAFDESLLRRDCSVNFRPVRLPHTTREVDFHYFDEGDYQMLCAYRRIFRAEECWRDRRLLLTFEGIGHDSTVYLNGEKIGAHHCGYTAFTLDITDKVDFEQENLLVVRVDSRESLNVPPFGFVIDYMTFGGIYRDVYLEVRGKTCLEDVFVKPKFEKRGKASIITTDLKISGDVDGLTIRQLLRRWNETSFHWLHEAVPAAAECSLTQQTGAVALWDTDSPNLYELKTELVDEAGLVVDEKTVRFGYRTAVFKKDGFFLNGRRVKLRGLNRHQSYPYVGYAMPESMQKLDADILKKELGLNAVRTSHYPQSQYFIDRCDELGLLGWTELPGWPHLGNEQWKAQAIENVKDMVLQYRNHPSVILWGVRINESVDDDAFYARTNAAARQLDPTRQTGGVRCYKKGSLLEDVYTYNDFSHCGSNRGCEPKKNVTACQDKPYLITEYNGHMFPCKTFDWEEKRAEHALRHARVLNDAALQSDIAGSFGWCMFDYHTHQDFGSGDRICYHGVMDAFRNPKLAAAVYAAQQEKRPVLEVSSTFDIGEHPGCNRGDVYIISNADRVRMYKNEVLLKEYSLRDSEFTGLAHGPVRVDDYVGDVLETQEHMSRQQAQAVKDILNEVAGVGLYRLSKKSMAKALLVSMRYRMRMSEAVELFNKYVGNWGGASTTFKFEAVKDGKVVAVRRFGPMKQLRLEAKADHTLLVEKNSYDVAAVRIRAVDENGNVLPYFHDPVKMAVTGPVELIGPDVISLPGGMGGTYLRTLRQSGDAILHLETVGGFKTEIKLTVEVR